MMKVVGFMMLLYVNVVQSSSCPANGNYVPMCSKCVYTAQCEKPFTCCPYLKVCLTSICAGIGSDDMARCSRAYWENSSGYPANTNAAKCPNPNFPNTWTSCTKCSSFNDCTNGKVRKTKNAGDITCAKKVCVAKDCCTSCRRFKCPDGQKLKSYPYNKFCKANPCTPTECCRNRPTAKTKFLQVDNKPAQCNVRGEFTSEQKRDALYWHNKARREVAKAGKCSNMLEMIWNDQVAAVASNYVAACNDEGAAKTFYRHNDPHGEGHPGRQKDYLACADQDTEGCVTTAKGPYCIGENIAYSALTFCRDGITASPSGACVSDCDSENTCTFQDLIYSAWVVGERVADQGTVCKDGSDGGHCRQVQWQNSEQVGCGFDDCPIGDYIGCDYFGPGNVQNENGELTIPCREGAYCTTGHTTMCPSTHQFCNDGLCSRVNIDTLTCDGEWSATCDGNCQKTYSITTRRADHITVCPHPHGKKKSCTGDDCGNVAAKITVTFPSIDFDNCCSGENKKAFLDQCSADNYPALCTDVTKGSAIVVFGGSVEAIKKVQKKVDTSTFKAIVVNGISFVTTGAKAISSTGVSGPSTCSNWTGCGLFAKTAASCPAGGCDKITCCEVFIITNSAVTMGIQTAIFIGMMIFV